ncbi:hypothetical protein GCM10009743_53730 [Kribbella swartbergensis]
MSPATCRPADAHAGTRPSTMTKARTTWSGPSFGSPCWFQINPAHTVTPSSDRGVATPRPERRRRITQPLRDEVVRRYRSGNQTAVEISEECALGKSTVLRILKASGVPMRRQGEKRL